ATCWSLTTPYHRVTLAAVVGEVERPVLFSVGIVECRRDRTQPVLANRNGRRLATGEAKGRAVAADQGRAQVGGLALLERELDGPRADQRFERQPCPERVGTKYVARTLQVEDRRVEELLGGGIPAAVAVQVDPEPILGIGH